MLRHIKLAVENGAGIAGDASTSGSFHFTYLPISTCCGLVAHAVSALPECKLSAGGKQISHRAPDTGVW